MTRGSFHELLRRMASARRVCYLHYCLRHGRPDTPQHTCLQDSAHRGAHANDCGCKRASCALNRSPQLKPPNSPWDACQPKVVYHLHPMATAVRATGGPANRHSVITASSTSLTPTPHVRSRRSLHPEAPSLAPARGKSPPHGTWYQQLQLAQLQSTVLQVWGARCCAVPPQSDSDRRPSEADDGRPAVLVYYLHTRGDTLQAVTQ